MIIASGNQLVQLAFVGTGNGGSGLKRNAAAEAKQADADVVAVEFDPRRELMFWIDSNAKRIYRSALAKGNQSHEGQMLNIYFDELGVSPLSMAVDYLTG